MSVKYTLTMDADELGWLLLALNLARQTCQDDHFSEINKKRQFDNLRNSIIDGINGIPVDRCSYCEAMPAVAGKHHLWSCPMRRWELRPLP